MSKSNKDPKLSRRAALAGLGALGGTAAIASCSHKWTPPESDPYGLARAKPYVPGAERWATDEERWATSSCAQCPAGCGIRVRVVEGRAVRIEGYEKNPLNQGGIGPRGLSGLQVLYDPDRITGPLVRKNGTLTKVSWDEALDVVGSALTKLRAEGESHRLLVMSGRERGMMNDLFSRFAEVYGTANFVDGRPNRSSVIAQAMEEALGNFEAPAYGWEDARYVLSLEAGLLEDSCQSVYLARHAAKRRHGKDRHRQRLAHAGPAFDLSAHNTDEWIRLAPGTAGAFALGLCRELLAGHMYDRGTVEAQTVGLGAFESAIQSYTPEYVAKITGVRPEVVARIASELWKHRPSFAYIDHRSVAYSNGRETALAAFALNALLGAIEAPEGGMRIAPLPPTRSWTRPRLDDIATRGRALPRMDRAGTDEFPRARSVHETLVEAIEKEPPKVALLYYTNPVYARHQPTRWQAALAKIPLVVSFSPFLDETVDQLAHVVLPDHTYLERYEDAMPAPALTRAVLGVRKPVIVPLHDTRASGDVVLELAQRIGGTVSASMPWKSFQGAMDTRLLGLHEAKRGTIREPSERKFLDSLYDVAVWEDPAPPAPRSVRFALPTSWTEPAWAGDPARYPLKLVLYRPLGHAEGSGANLPWLHTLRARPGARAWEHSALVHPSSVPGLADGDVATIASEWGEVVMPVRFERRMLPGFVEMSVGQGHTAFGRFAKGIGVNAMTLAAPGAAPITGASVLCATRVQVKKGGRHA